MIRTTPLKRHIIVPFFNSPLHVRADEIMAKAGFDRWALEAGFIIGL
jgi:hypothetical protein